MTPAEITELIKGGRNDELEKVLKDDPAIADSKTEQGLSLLLYAVYCNNKKAIELIRQGKSHLDIYEAAGTGDTSIVKDEIEKNPSLINSFSVDGFTPLGLSCFFQHAEVARYLIEKGADVNIPSNNSFKVAPIHSACAVSDFELVTLLIKNGADVNAKQQADITPLHAAAHNGQNALAELLINAGADVNAKTVDGKTPVMMAEEKSFTETAALIKSRGGK
jgi:ankyrin repeat protein